jgi:DNA-binding protein HU-beta
MNKTDIAAADAASVSKADAVTAVNSTFDAIANALASGDSVQLFGFGTFSVADRAAKKGRNPRTGATIQIAASKQPKFKAAKGLKDAASGRPRARVGRTADGQRPATPAPRPNRPGAGSGRCCMLSGTRTVERP